MTKETAWPKANGLKLTTAAVATPVAMRRKIPLNVSPQMVRDPVALNQRALLDLKSYLD
jgi:hypothetical protein